MEERFTERTSAYSPIRYQKEVANLMRLALFALALTVADPATAQTPFPSDWKAIPAEKAAQMLAAAAVAQTGCGGVLTVDTSELATALALTGADASSPDVKRMALSWVGEFTRSPLAGCKAMVGLFGPTGTFRPGIIRLAK